MLTRPDKKPEGNDKHLEILKWVNGLLTKSKYGMLTTRPEPGYVVVQPYTFTYVSGENGYLVPLRSTRIVRSSFELYASNLRSFQKPHLNAADLGALMKGTIPSYAWRVYWCVHEDLNPSEWSRFFLLDYLREQVGREDVHFCVTLKHRGNQLVPSIQAIDDDGQIIGHVRLGHDETSNTHILNETRTLHLLGREPHSTFRLPKTICENRWWEHRVFIQTSHLNETDDVDGTFSTQHQTILTELSHINRHREYLQTNHFWINLQHRVENIVSREDYRLLSQAIDQIKARLESIMLPFYLSHGDFAPWNIGQPAESDKPYLYNWQNASMSAPAGSDIFHYFVSYMRVQVGANAVDTLSTLMPGGSAYPHIQAHLRHVRIMPSAINALLRLYLVDKLSRQDQTDQERAFYKEMLVSLVN